MNARTKEIITSSKQDRTDGFILQNIIFPNWRVLKTPILIFSVVAISMGYNFYTGGKVGF